MRKFFEYLGEDAIEIINFKKKKVNFFKTAEIKAKYKNLLHLWRKNWMQTC